MKHGVDLIAYYIQFLADEAGLSCEAEAEVKAAFEDIMADVDSRIEEAIHDHQEVYYDGSARGGNFVQVVREVADAADDLIDWLDSLERAIGTTALLDAMPNNTGGRVRAAMAVHRLRKLLGDL